MQSALAEEAPRAATVKIVKQEQEPSTKLIEIPPETTTAAAEAQQTSDPVTEPEPVTETEPRYSDREIDILAKMVWGEARGCAPDEQRLVVWTVFQRVEDDRFPDTIEAVITAKGQFYGYKTKHPVDPDIRDLCVTEFDKWMDGAEPPTLKPYAPTAPYLYFTGRRCSDGLLHNFFREAWK